MSAVLDVSSPGYSIRLSPAVTLTLFFSCSAGDNQQQFVHMYKLDLLVCFVSHQYL